MSGGIACRCGEAKEPIYPGKNSNRPGRLWRVMDYKCNHSAFNGYRRASSDYSSITCLRCGARWRTKATYAGILDGLKEEERHISSGYGGHEKEMEARGRTVWTR